MSTFSIVAGFRLGRRTLRIAVTKRCICARFLAKHVLWAVLLTRAPTLFIHLGFRACHFHRLAGTVATTVDILSATRIAVRVANTGIAALAVTQLVHANFGACISPTILRCLAWSKTLATSPRCSKAQHTECDKGKRHERTDCFSTWVLCVVSPNRRTGLC